MKGYLTLIFTLFVILLLGEKFRKRSFRNLSVKRKLNIDKMIFPGDEFKVTTEVENKEWAPIDFINLCEIYDTMLYRIGDTDVSIDEDTKYYYSSYSLAGCERIKRTYRVKAERRGTFFLGNMYVVIGDVFGLEEETKDIEDFVEVLIYPRIYKAKDIMFNNNSLQGDHMVKRWIYPDPLIIKGIREYTPYHRMKDIHWNSSAKTGKLMVREYDYTSEKKIMFIMNTQFGNPYWSYIDKDGVDKIIEVTMSLCDAIAKDGMEVGAMTNGQIVNYHGQGQYCVNPYSGSMGKILELGARVDYTCNKELKDLLQEEKKKFDMNTVYVLVTAYIGKDIEGEIKNLSAKGYTLKIIDTSKDYKLPFIPNVEKINYSGRRG